MKQTLVILLVVAISLFFISAAIAAKNADPLGAVTSHKGRFQIKKKESRIWTDAITGMQVYYGDAVRTGDKSQGL